MIEELPGTGESHRETALRRAMAVLMEEFRSVQIIAVAISEDGRANMHTIGDGSYFERIGAVRDWVNDIDNETIVNEVRKLSGGAD